MNVQAVVDETRAPVKDFTTLGVLAFKGCLSHHSKTMAMFQALVSVQVTTVTKGLATVGILTNHSFHVAATTRKGAVS